MSFYSSEIIPSSLFGDIFFFFNDTATTEIYTLSLHDALPISRAVLDDHRLAQARGELVGDAATHDVGHAARGEGHDHPERAAGEGLLRERVRREQRRAQCRPCSSVECHDVSS